MKQAWHKVISGGLAAVAMIFTASAGATNYTTNVGTVAPATPYTQTINHLAPAEPVGTSFIDVFNFQVGGAGFSSVAINLDLSPYLTIPNLALSLYAGQDALGSLLAGPVSAGVTLSYMLMTNTDYSLKVTGQTAGTLGGSYSLAIAAVPEADALPMLVAGLALVGLMARRARRV